MRWIGDYEWIETGRLRARAQVAPDHLFVASDGTLDPVALIEWIAQASALLCAHEALLSGRPPRMGYLAGIRGFQWSRLPRVGDALEIDVCRQMTMGEASVIHGVLKGGASPWADAVLTVWETQSDLSAWANGGAAMTDDGPLHCPSQSHPAERHPRLSPPAIQAMVREGLRGAIETLGAQVRAVFCFPADAAVFRGHFPGYPILPGIDILAMAQSLCAHSCGEPLLLLGAAPTKFLDPVRPDEQVTMELTIERLRERPHRIGVRGRLKGARKNKAAFALEFRVAESGVPPREAGAC
jgi:3-hydroxymyristoyl/3-hydroxydecanoyl-(acyl carrier protein) dehydratase